MSPTKHKRETVLFTQAESTDLHAQATEKELTFSNLIRQKLKLPVFKRGAEKGNKRAAGNKGRWGKGNDEKE